MNIRPRRVPGPRILIVTAVEAERAAVLRGLSLPDDPAAIGPTAHVVVATGGVGSAAAAAATTELLLTAHGLSSPFGLVVSAGIAGGFAGRAAVGAAVLATSSVAADLGADSPDGFLSLDALGFGSSTLPADGPALAALTSALPTALTGEILTVATVTGTAQRAADLARRHPTALAEAMEGFGVATAASRAGVAFAELRTVSNPIGARDRSAWRIDVALAALAEAVGALASLVP